MRWLLFGWLTLVGGSAAAQMAIDTFGMFGDVRITVDRPGSTDRKRERILVLYALPNGNTTEWTRGKHPRPGDDWHFDIQHIGAQTRFVRQALPEKDVYVCYLETTQKSWPAWKKQHPSYRELIQELVDRVRREYGNKKTSVYLNGHSGGGSFLFGFLDGVKDIPTWIGRIGFLDANYGYDSSYAPKLRRWLKRNRAATLIVFAYNDSVALYNGKPIVSPTGGTWYRSGRMMQDLRNWNLRLLRSDSLLVYEGRKRKVQFLLRTNPDRKIYHTQQVEYNGFIHTLLFRTRKEHVGYRYYGARAYTHLIQE